MPGAEAPEGAVVLSMRAGDLDVEVVAHESLNYALVHNGASPVARLTVHNRGLVPAHDVRVEVDLTRDLVLRMPGGHGLVVNPGHEVGFELFPDAVQAVAQRARDAAPDR